MYLLCGRFCGQTLERVVIASRGRGGRGHVGGDGLALLPLEELGVLPAALGLAGGRRLLVLVRIVDAFGVRPGVDFTKLRLTNFTKTPFHAESFQILRHISTQKQDKLIYHSIT
jgi:hypothetical protein